MTFFATLRRFCKGRRGARGATAVEFALVAPVFLIFVLGIMDFGRLFWVKNLMQYGADKTARYAMVNPSVAATTLEDYADAEIGDMFTGITFEVTTETIDGVEYRTVSASYTFSFFMPLALDDIVLSAKSRTPVNEL